MTIDQAKNFHVNKANCACAARPGTHANSVHLNRLEAAVQRGGELLKDKHKHGKAAPLQDASVHVFDRGFGVGSWIGAEAQLTFAAVGVVDGVPAEATLVFDTAFFKRAGEGKDQDILWVEMQIFSPTRQTFKVPFRGVGVLRDPGTGNLLRCERFELATHLIADVGDIAKIIVCVLACVGLFCAALCGPLCITVIACIACLGACVGANTPQFLTCVTACGIAVEGIKDALS
ncbi:MAG: hypothetical protein R6X02_26645 [Enhygromyxa sp.]